jgi:RNA polymerase sigma-70 factor (ECF subfamily)
MCLIIKFNMQFNKLSDFELVKLLRTEKKSAEGAFTELYHRYSPMVNAYCLKIVGNQQQSDDIFQDTFIKFYQNVKEDFPQTNVPGFLIKIARNLCLNLKRDRKNNVPIEELEYLGVNDYNYENKELLELITMALDLLDFEYSEAFILREYDGLQYDEIAEITNTSVSNAKSRVFRAKQKIRDLLEPYLKDLNKNLNTKLKR